MHDIQPARLKPGVTREAVASAASAVEKATSTAVIRGRALILWDLKVLGKKKKLDAIDTDQITPGRRLRVRKPRHARRALEGRRVPLPDARFPGARPSRRDVRHRRRSLRDRLVARDEPGRAEGDRRRSRPRDGHRLRQQHGRHLPPQRAQPRAAGGAESGGGGRRQGRRRVQLRAAVAAADERDAGQDLRAGAAQREGRRDSPDRRHLRGGPARVQGRGGSGRRASSGPTPNRRAA